MVNVTSGKKNHSQLKVFITYLPVFLAVVLMLPRLASPKFGLFDDGKSIVTAQRLAGGDWSFQFDQTDARYRPLYWLSFAAIYNLDGGTPFAFFFINMLALVATTAALIAFLRRAGASHLQAGLAGLFFVLSGPIIENYYTLSKGEWLQLLFISLSLLLVTYFQAKSPKVLKIVLIVGVSVAILFASMSKETSIVLFPISAVWFIADWIWHRRKKGQPFDWRAAFFIANVIATGCYFLLRSFSINKAISVQGYTSNYSFTLAQVEASVIRWTGWLIRDFIWVVPIVGLAIIFVILRRKLTGGNTLLFDSLVWMGGWICIYLPWTLMAEYYMLPFALGAAVFVSACMIEIVPALRETGWRPWLTRTIFCLSVLLMIGALLDNLTNARVQLAIDSANGAMMNYLVQNAVPNSTVYLNIQGANEYTDEITMQLNQVDGRPDLQLITFQPNIDLHAKPGTVYMLSPFVENQPLLTVRMGVVEATQKAWNQSLRVFLQSQPQSQVVFNSNASFQLSDVNYPRLFCALIKTRSFCALPAPDVDLREFSYGWQVTRVVQP